MSALVAEEGVLSWKHGVGLQVRTEENRSNKTIPKTVRWGC